MLLSFGDAVSQKRSSWPANRANASRWPANRPSANRPFSNFNFNGPAANYPTVKRVPRYQLHLKITDGPTYSVSVNSLEGASEIDFSGLDSLIKDLRGGESLFELPIGQFPKVTIEPGPDIRMDDLWHSVDLFPRHDMELNLLLGSGEGSGSLSYEPNRRSTRNDDPFSQFHIIPNPLLLVVSVNDEVGALLLNNEPFGTLSDTGPLSKKLMEVFKAREENGVFREGTKEVEKSVTIMLPKSPRRKVFDFMTIAGAVRLSGRGSGRV